MSEDDKTVTASQPPDLPVKLGAIASYATAPEPDLLNRESVVNELLALHRTQSRRLPVLVGGPGSGKTTVIQLMAEQLPRPTLVVSGSAIAWRLGQLKDCLDFCKKNDVLVVIDDIDIALGLGEFPPSVFWEQLAIFSKALDDPNYLLMATTCVLPEPVSEARERQIDAAVAVVTLPPVDRAHLLDVARKQAERLSGHHNIEITDSVAVALVNRPAALKQVPAPGQIYQAMDLAAARVVVANGGTLNEPDLQLPNTELERVDTENLKAKLAERIFGQDQAIDRVAKVVARTRLQLDARPERPDGVFLLAGPSGTGKTELARTLAQILHGDEDKLIRLDMGEYSDRHTVSKLIGAPPGYVGSDSPEGWLTTRIRQQPDCVLLLDEMEKAHDDVWNVFLSVFDAGRLSDSSPADFSRVTIVATTNLGASAFQSSEIGFVPEESEDADKQDEAVHKIIRSRMPPELVNRFDAVIVLHPLPEDVVHRICQVAVKDVQARAKKRGWDLIVDDEAIRILAKRGYHRDYGARELHRVVERNLLDPLLEKDTGRYKTAIIDGGVTLEPA
jgi:ATP-dependent Clp protease ATP-binding subunit ClpA